MTEPTTGRQLRGADAETEETSLLELVNELLRHRRTIIALGICGLVFGMMTKLVRPRVYTSAATFIPQGSDGGTSGLALAASQLGLRVATTTGGTWGPPIYVELLRSRALLIPIALDSVVVAERGGRRTALTDLLGIKAPSPNLRAEYGVRALRDLVQVGELKPLGAVQLSVTTQWPSVSLALAEQLVGGVNRFNLDTRKSQAVAERKFVETQAREAEDSLQRSESRLLTFSQRNRAISDSPELAFERDRLRRDVGLRTQVYTTLLQGLVEARMHEVRDTPVITVLETPRLPEMADPRHSLERGFLGALTGAILGALVVFVSVIFGRARRGSSKESREFFQLVSDATPRFLKRVER